MNDTFKRLAAFALFATSLWAAPRTLLPQPAKIKYGPGHLPIQGLTIRFGQPPNAEDRFAADELAKDLSAYAGAAVAVSDAPSGKTILLTRSGTGSALAMPREEPGPASRESYQLKVTGRGVEVRAPSSAGIFYAVQTLRQLVEGEGIAATLPEVEIEDWPALVYRGVMVDMSHGPLPTVEEIQRQLDFLAGWKINQYYFYNEASIELKGYSLINPDGRFTQDQVREIIEYGKTRHIDVIPCLELYGHLHDVFRIERYADLSPLPHGEQLDPRNLKVAQLLADWTEQYANLFPSPFVHIGFDETWQLAIAAKKQGGSVTPEKLFAEQLKAVAEPFQRRGKTVMAWADMMIKYPAILHDLPPGLIAVPWEYSAMKDYSSWLDPLVANSTPEMICTAVSNWNRIASDLTATFDDIDTFLSAGRRAHTLGIINTLWTDDAQGLMRTAWPGLAYGGAAAWQQDPLDRANFLRDYSRLMYREAVAPSVASALEKLSAAEVHLEKAVGRFHTAFAIWDDPFTAASLKRSTEHKEDLREARLLAEDAQEELYKALSLGGDPAALSSLLFAGREIDYAGMKFIHASEIAERWKALTPDVDKDEYFYGIRVETYAQSHSRIVDLMDEITELRRHYQSLWLQEYTPYRLDSALGRWDAEYQYWRAMQTTFRVFWERHKVGQPLPPLESVTQPR